MNAREAYEFALINGPSKEVENIISNAIGEQIALSLSHVPWSYFDIVAKNAWYSYLYARDVLKGPFPDGEEEISKCGGCSFLYAYEVLNGPFLKGERSIAERAYDSYLYARLILKGRFITGEASIMKFSLTSYLYSCNVLKGRFKEGEKSITVNIPISLEYQFKFNRNICSSEQLADYPAYALSYAIMIGGRFSEGEPSMRNSPRIWKRYQEFIDDSRRSTYVGKN